MNTAETMQALLDGKCVTASYMRHNGEFMKLVGIHIRDKEGDIRDLRATADYELYEEPNTHVPGTFAWAREEARRGKTVRRAGHEKLRFTDETINYPHSMVAIGNIDGTDWEVVP